MGEPNTGPGNEPPVILIEDPETQARLLTDARKLQLVISLLHGSFDTVTDLSEQTRARLLALSMSGDISMDVPAEAAAVMETDEWQVRLKETIQSVERLRSGYKLTLAAVDREAVGFTGFNFLGTHPENNREVYEIKHGSVLKEYRNRQISSQLQKRTIERIKHSHHDAYMLSWTKTAQRAHAMARAGAVPISVEDHVAIEWYSSDESRRISLEHRKLKVAKTKDAWQAWLLDLRDVRD